MPLEIHHETDLVRVVLKGTLTEADLVALAKEAEETERNAGVSPNRLTDGTAVSEITITFHQMQAFALRRRTATVKNKMRSAIVAPGPLRYGFARMFQTLNDNPKIEISIFGDTAAAVRWLKEKEPEARDEYKRLIDTN
jgi:hypothetical protein